MSLESIQNITNIKYQVMCFFTNEKEVKKPYMVYLLGYGDNFVSSEESR